MATPVAHHAVTRSPERRAQHADLPVENELTPSASPENITDQEDDTDDEDDDFPGDADSMVGISMSRAQTDMKLPSTPAATKEEAMQASRSYFEPDAEENEVMFDEPLQKECTLEESASPQYDEHQRAQSVPSPYATPQPPSPSRISIKANTQQKPDKRSSLVSSILGSTSGNTRPRSSSGSSIVENLRKRLPNLPTFSLPKFGNSTEVENTGNTVLGPAAAGAAPKSRSLLPSAAIVDSSPGDNTNTETSQLNAVRPQVNDSREEAKDLHAPRQPLLRRATSDQSIYLRRAATGASQFDDYTVFSDVSEMVNSRFKAISDSFQDSAFRRPKLLSVGQNDGKNTPGRTDSDEARQNTKMNAGQSQRVDISLTVDDERPGVNSNSKHPLLKEALSRMTGDLVIMGGYRGSILRDAETKRQLWVPIKVGMNLRKADLEVGLTREDELRMGEKIYADGALSHIGPVDICRRLLRKCHKCPNVQTGKLRIHDYGYDWRLSPDLLAERLIRFLEGLPCNQPGQPFDDRGAWLISHSLGGLLTRHITNRRPDLIAGILYAGTPQNCVNILGPLRNGDDVLFSSRVLTAQVNFTLRTSYVLLPQNGRCFINKQTGERYDVNFFDPKTWDEYRLSPCIKQPIYFHKPEKKTGVMGSISEAISLPTKRMSWFTSNDASRGASEPTNQIKETAEDMANDVADAAEKAKPERPLSPTMDDSSTRHHKPSVATTSNIPLPVATEYLERTLGSVLKFKQELVYRPSLQARNAYPPATVLFAKNTPTVYGAFVTSREAIKYDNAFDDLAFAAGDGVVLASAAQLPTGYKCVGRVESDRGHVGLLGDLEGVGQCLLALMRARAKGVGRGAYEMVQDRASKIQPSTSQVPKEEVTTSQ